MELQVFCGVLYWLLLPLSLLAVLITKFDPWENAFKQVGKMNRG